MFGCQCNETWILQCFPAKQENKGFYQRKVVCVERQRPASFNPIDPHWIFIWQIADDLVESEIGEGCVFG